MKFMAIINLHRLLTEGFLGDEYGREKMYTLVK